MPDASERVLQRCRERRNAARLAGALLLITNASAVVDELLIKAPLVVPGDASATAMNIASNEQLFRIGLGASMLTLVGVAVLIWALYELLRDVRRDLVVLAAAIRWIECAVGVMAIMFSLATLVWLGQAPYLSAFEPNQLHVLGRSFLRLQGLSLTVMFVLVGVGSAVFAYVLRESGQVPKGLAVLGMGASTLLGASSFLVIVFPAISPYQLTLILPMGLYEVSLGVWLLVKGKAIGSHISNIASESIR